MIKYIDAQQVLKQIQQIILKHYTRISWWIVFGKLRGQRFLITALQMLTLILIFHKNGSPLQETLPYNRNIINMIELLKMWREVLPCQFVLLKAWFTKNMAVFREEWAKLLQGNEVNIFPNNQMGFSSKPLSIIQVVFLCLTEKREKIRAFLLKVSKFYQLLYIQVLILYSKKLLN